MRVLNGGAVKQEVQGASSNAMFIHSLLLFGCFIYLEQILSQQQMWEWGVELLMVVLVDFGDADGSTENQVRKQERNNVSVEHRRKKWSHIFSSR